jgi:hypothetical protein
MQEEVVSTLSLQLIIRLFQETKLPWLKVTG